MAYTEDVNVNLNVLAGTMGGVTAIMGGMSALTSSFGAMSTEAVSSFGTIDGLLVTSAALLTTFGLQAAEAFGEFEQGMKIVQTVSGQAQYSVAQLGEQANQLSVHYRTAIGDITEGLQTLGRAGLNSAETQLEVLESGLQTAKLEGRNLNGVLEEIIQNTAMLGGDLKSIDFGEQSSYLNSLMVGTSMTAPINSHDISQTLQYAGGTAAAAGANLENKDKLEDLMGTIAAFAQKGVKGSMSGTALRAFFTKPASQDTSVVDALGSIGLSPEDLWENGGESMKKVSDQVAIIKRRMEALNLSTMEQVELWGKIVGPKMGQQMMKLDASSVKDLTRDIQGAQSAQDLANKTLNTYNQKLSSLTQQGQVAYRELGEKAVMFLSPLVDILNLLAQFASDPAGNMVIWIGSLALLGHGIRAAWNMITSVASQVKGLIMQVVDGVEAIAASTTGVSEGFTQSASRADLLNLKLKETNATMQAIQASALGINNANWVANGAAVGSKVDKGVISSMERNMYIGGTSQNGMNFGVPGQYYRPSDKAGLEQQMRETSAENKANVDRITAVSDKLTAEIQRVEGRLGRVNDKIAEYKTISGHNPGIDEANAMFPRTPVSDEKGALNMLRIQRQSLESQLATMPKEDVRAKLMEESGVTEQDIIATKELIAKKKELEQKLKDSQKAYVESQVAWAKKQKYDSKGKEIKNKDAYVSATEEKAPGQYWGLSKKSPFGRERQQLEKELEKIKYELSKDMNALKIAEMKPSQYAEVSAKIEEIKQLENQIKQTSGQNLQKLIQQAEAERESVLIKLRELYAAQGALPTTEALNEMFPQMSDKEIKALTKELTTTLQTQIQIVEEEVYRAEIARLEKLAATSPIAAQDLKDNKELEKAGQSRVQGILGYRQLVKNSPVPEKQSEIVGMATKNQANQNALKMAQAMEQATIQSTKQIQGVGTRIRDKLQKSGQNYINSWGNVLNTGASKIGLAAQNVEYSLKGLAVAIPEASTSVMTVSEEFAMSGMTFEEAMGQLTAATGLTSEQIAMIALSEDAAAEEWITAISAMVAADDQEIIAIENLIRAKLAETVASGGASGGKIMSSLESVTGFMGGPFMAGMMAFTVASSLFQQSVSNWQKEMSDAANQVSEAKDKMSTTEENIKELYSSENNTISEADLDKIVDYQYAGIQQAYNADMDSHGRKVKPKFSDMYNNEVIKVQNLTWTDEEKENNTLKTSEDLQALNESTETLTLTEEENIKKLEENTVALNQASYAFSQALNKEAKAFNDPMHGYQGMVTKIEEGSNFSGFMAMLDILPGFMSLDRGIAELRKNFDDSGFFDHDSGILTKYQSGDDFAGSTDFAPALSLQMYTMGSEDGLRNFFGNDFHDLVASVDHINQQSGSMVNYMSSLTNNGFQGMDADDMAMAQMLWKEDPETIQKLGKQMYWYETEHPGQSAKQDWQTGTLRQKDKKERHPSADNPFGDSYKKIEKTKFSVNDKNLDATLQKIYRMTDGKLSYANILAMGQMQQLADMYSVANEQIYPALAQTMIAANQNVLATGQAGTNAGSAASGAGAAANNAAVIAGMLGEKLKQEVGGLEYENDYLTDPNGVKSFFGIHNPWIGNTLTKEEFLQGYNDLDNSYFNNYRLHGAQTEMAFTGRTLHPDWSEDQIQGYVNRSTEKMFNADGSIKEGVYKNWGVMQNTILSPALDTVADTVRAAYEQSSVGEYGGDSGSGGGGSGGGGSGKGSGSDSGSGTRKERVDLVLCNKKEIPKLNVNLFKKPPNFTILNKNFKLRDIKINSQDKPKAIMNAIKNGIIETQKRMDPKIIQDDVAEFDPVSATEGNSVPKGNTKTTT